MSRQNVLNDILLDRINKTIWHIKKNNEYYFKLLGCSKEVTSYEDFQKIPFLTKEQLVQGYPYGFLCADINKLVRVHMSSGTVLRPVLNPMTRNDVEQWKEIMGKCFQTAGVTENDIIQVTPSFGMYNGGFGFHYGAEKIGAYIVPMGPGRSILQLKFLEDLEVTVLAAISSYPLRLIEVAKKEGFDFKKRTKLKKGIFGAEVWSDNLRKRIEREMSIETYDIVGMTETGGVGMGIDCIAHSGIHIWDDHYFIEIVDAETGEVKKDGEEGELVVTTLTREGLPLIRYRTRDITRIIAREKCECGLQTVKIDRIKGRYDDMIKVKGVNFYPSSIESILMEFDDLWYEYQILLEKKNEKTEITLIVETENHVNEDVVDRPNMMLYDLLGFKINIKFVPLGFLKRSSGKSKRVVDNR
jgi:phenylacetate-CoA ligase